MGDRPPQLKAASKVRLDALLVERGLAASRERARALILAGEVRVNGQRGNEGRNRRASRRARVAARPGSSLRRAAADSSSRTRSTPSRIDAAGRIALDVGASTGGFTDVLLQRGAARVVALDVGHGQLDWKLRNDPRVVVRERVNARTLTAADLPADCQRFDDRRRSTCRSFRCGRSCRRCRRCSSLAPTSSRS